MVDSSRILGDAVSQMCIHYAGLLNFDIYDQTEDDVPDALKPYVRINRTHWEKHPEIQADDDDGFRCCLYLPKNRGQNEGISACPPVMVYRGSDSEERDREQLIFGMAGSYDFLLDLPSFPRVPEDVAFAGTFDHSGGIHPGSFGKTMAELRALPNHFEETMFINETGTERFNVSIPILRDGRATLTWTLSSSLFYGLQGDWPVNFAQGLGNNVPPQYIKAIEFGRLAAAFAATEEWGHRIVFTGHSLGGGLASAGAIAARKRHDTLRIEGRTYNSAGLHSATAATIPAALSAASDVPIRAYHVHSEILNSMQSRNRIVPLLADLLEWSGKSMPGAVPNPIAEDGISPGNFPILDFFVRSEGETLPKLFPFRDEQFVNSNFPHLGPILDAAAAANDLQTFVTGVVDYLIGAISEDDLLHHSEARELQNLTLPSLGALEGAVMAAVLTGSAVPSVSVGTTEYARTMLNPLVNGLIRDLVGLARLFLASGNYHTFYPCAYTFLLPGLREN